MTELRICGADLLESLYLLLILKSTKALKAIRDQEGATNVVYAAQPNSMKPMQNTLDTSLSKLADKRPI